MEDLKFDELIEINGGHQGPAYQAGVEVGHFLTGLATVAACVAIFLMPKS